MLRLMVPPPTSRWFSRIAPHRLLLVGLCCSAACFSPELGTDVADELGEPDESATDTGLDSDGTGEGSSGDVPGSEGDDAGASSQDTEGDEETGEPDEDGDQALACQEYCSLIDDHCGEVAPQYPGLSVCQAVCLATAPGASGDALGNSVACRTHHAVLAARTPETHCLHAGPTGDGTCGASCESFCGLALAVCTGDDAPWPDADTCIESCTAWPQEPQYRADVEDADTFACRMRHLTLATLQPELHCAHVDDDSPVCAG